MEDERPSLGTRSVETRAARVDNPLVVAETWASSTDTSPVVRPDDEEFGDEFTPKEENLRLGINTPVITEDGEVRPGPDILALAKSLDGRVPELDGLQDYEDPDNFGQMGTPTRGDRKLFGVLRTLVMLRDSFKVPLSRNTRRYIRMYKDYLFRDCDLE